MNKLPKVIYLDCLGASYVRPEEYEMGAYALSFNELQKRYYMDAVDDRRIAECTTQQQYYSMLINKRRLQMCNLKKQTSVDLPNNRYFWIPMKKEGDILSGLGERKVKAVREFYLEDKKIYSKKIKGVSNIHLLKYDVQDGHVSCPNCGMSGNVESFYAGCKYCGASFEIKSFAPKISFF